MTGNARIVDRVLATRAVAAMAATQEGTRWLIGIAENDARVIDDAPARAQHVVAVSTCALQIDDAATHIQYPAAGVDVLEIQFNGLDDAACWKDETGPG